LSEPYKVVQGGAVSTYLSNLPKPQPDFPIYDRGMRMDSVWWSYDATTERLANRNIDPEHLKDLAINFFSKTRWRRTFLLAPGHRLD
jgi:hypothetical protein